MICKELSLEASYRGSWGLDEGIREFISNAFDARTENGAEIDIRYKPEINKLIIATTGALLNRETLLFGHSTKMNRDDLIGRFGEGLKLGSLACVRAGHPVTIRTGSETWKPSIVRSKTYNANVLSVSISEGRKFVNRVAIEISNVTPEMWDVSKRQFIELCPIAPKDKIHIPGLGTIILDPEYINKVFVKGIAVKDEINLSYGYDFVDMQVDCDRKMISDWDLKWRCKIMWNNAVNVSGTLETSFVRMIKDPDSELQYRDSYETSSITDDTLNNIVNMFEKENGHTAFPVCDEADSRKVDSFDKKGVVVPLSYLTILKKHYGDVETLELKFNNSVCKRFDLDELHPEEFDTLEDIKKDINAGFGFPDELVDVVNFKNPTQLSHYDKENERIELARSVLRDSKEARRILVKEFSNYRFDIGHSNVADSQVEIWSNMFNALKDK